MKELYVAADAELIRLQSMDAITSSPTGEGDPDELPVFPV